MASSSLFNNHSRIVLAGVLTFSFALQPLQAETVRPFPAIGSVTVNEGHWNDVPEFQMKLAESVTNEPLRFQLLASAAEDYFSQGLWEESRRAFQRLLKAKKPSPSLFYQETGNLRVAELL